jgi:hypothetical protein
MSCAVLGPFVFCGSLRSVGISSSLKFWYNSSDNLSGSALFFYGRLFIAAAIS